jgi:transcriptional regulator with XRE-family HTH domain
VTLSPERARVLAQQLREARTTAGLTQVALAELAGLTAEHIQKLERGVGSPTLASVYALADALRRPIGDLLP